MATPSQKQLGIIEFSFPIALDSSCLTNAVNIWQSLTPAEQREHLRMRALDIVEMYPSIPHDVLMSTLAWLIDLLSSKQYLDLRGTGNPTGRFVLRVPRNVKKPITRSPLHLVNGTPTEVGIRYAQEQADSPLNTNYKTHQKTTFKQDLLVDSDYINLMLTVILKHSYFRFGSNIYNQTHSMPMGNQTGAQSANGHVFVYEYKYLSALVERYKDTLRLRAIVDYYNNNTTDMAPPPPPGPAPPPPPQRPADNIELEPGEISERMSIPVDEQGVRSLPSFCDVQKQADAIISEATYFSFYCRFLDDVYDLGNPFFQNIINAFPAHLHLVMADSNDHNRALGCHYMDLFLQQSPTYPFDIAITLYDKRRGWNYSSIDIHYYTYGHTFLASHQIGTGTVTSQFHRFRRRITVETNFCIEMAIMLIKLASPHHCDIPREHLIRKVRNLLFKYPYRYGRAHNTDRPTTPKAIFDHIMALFTRHWLMKNGVTLLIGLTPQIVQERKLRDAQSS